MRRILAALVGGCAIGLALFTTLAVAFLYGVGPAEHLIDRETLHHI